MRQRMPGDYPQDNALGPGVGRRINYYDLIISRFSAGSATDVTTQVNKVITYEDESEPFMVDQQA